MLHEIYTGSKRNCFLDTEAAFCGNMVTEDDEQCDCGYEDDCTEEVCCNAKDAPTEQGQQCRLREGADCR